MKKFIHIIIITGLVACIGKNKNKNADTNLNGNNDSSATKTEVLDDARPSPLKKTTGFIDGVKTTVQWGSPSVKGREIWGMIVPYDEVWRTGANEATWIEFDKDVMINDKALAQGKYGFFTIPREGEWTLIFNTVWNQWGAFEYDEKQDALRINIKPDTASLSETLEYAIKQDGVSICWEKLKIRFTVKKK